jgi:LmbE family N-acetylglucosaminyl deacetylase
MIARVIDAAKRVLVLAPHTDDAELGCGGTLARMLEEGTTILLVAFSSAAESLSDGMATDTLVREFKAAARILGLDEKHTQLHSFTVRRLAEHRQEILEQLVRIRREFEPDVVLMPSGNDVHQEHQVIHNEGLRAFKELSVLGYELPWNHITFSAQAFVRLEERHVEKKAAVLKAYRSQIALGRPYFAPEYVRSLASVRGIQIKTTFAEAFEVVRLMI